MSKAISSKDSRSELILPQLRHVNNGMMMTFIANIRISSLLIICSLNFEQPENN